MKIRIGYGLGTRSATNDQDRFVELVDGLEREGFDSLWLSERITGDCPDPLVGMAFAVARTTKLKVGMSVMVLPGRNPVVLAKSLASLDRLSNGRLLPAFGIGVGWLEEEFDALGISWAKRGKRTDEYMEAMRALWAEDDAGYEGEFVSFTNVSSNPKPEKPVPFVIGGHSAAAARRAGRLGDGYFPGKGSIAELTEQFDIVRQSAADAGRDADAIEFTAGHPGIMQDPVGAAQELASIGVTRTILPAFLFLGSEGAAAKAAELAETIIGPIADI